MFVATIGAARAEKKHHRLGICPDDPLDILAARIAVVRYIMTTMLSLPTNSALANMSTYIVFAHVNVRASSPVHRHVLAHDNCNDVDLRK